MRSSLRFLLLCRPWLAGAIVLALLAGAVPGYAQVPEAQVPEAQVPEAQVPEAQVPEAQVPEEGKAPEPAQPLDQEPADAPQTEAPEEVLPPGQQADPSLSLDQLLERHRAARFGNGSSAIKTLRAVGKLNLMGFDLPMKMVFSRPDACLLSADLQGMEMILAYDGETAWTVSPLQGIVEPEALPEDAAEAIALFSDVVWGLLGPEARQQLGIELAGIEKVARDEAYRLTLQAPDGSQRDLYLGGEDFLERKLHLEAIFMGRAQSIDALLGDYRDLDGLQMPHEIQLVADGVPLATIRLEQVEVNVELDEAIFELPPKPPAPEEAPQPQ